MERGSSSIFQPLPTSSTGTTPESPTPTIISSDCSSTTSRYHSSTPPLPDPSLNDPNLRSPTLQPLPDSSVSFTPSPATANSSEETSTNPLTTKPGKSLNVTALAIGVTGAALLLIVCAVISFRVWKRKQKNKVPPSAEFRDVAFVGHPRNHREIASPTSSTFTRKDRMSFAASPLRPSEV